MLLKREHEKYNEVEICDLILSNMGAIDFDFFNIKLVICLSP